MDGLWHDLTTPPPPDRVFTIGWMAYLALFTAGFVVAVYLSGPAAFKVVRHPVRRRMVRRLAAIAAWIFGFGLFFFGIRALQINPLSFGTPIWLWLCLIALVVFAAYAAWQVRSELPAQMAAFEREQVKQRYLKAAPRGSRGGGPTPRAAARRR